MNVFWWIVVLCLLTAAAAFPQERNGSVNGALAADIDYEAIRLDKIVTAIRVVGDISLDGRLDELAWKQAGIATDFITSQPRSGEPATERTEVRFVYDDNTLYVGFTVWDGDASDNVVVLREDFTSQESDGVSMVLDSLHDRRSAFQFGTNPAGAKRDSQITNNSQFNNDWDSVWDVKVITTDEGWTAEFAIPFKTLRFVESDLEQEWGVNLSRFTVRRNEQSFWSPIPIRYSMSRISQAGTLRGLGGIRQGRNVRIKPFATAGVTQSRRTDGAMQTLRDYDGGVDAKYSLTPSLTLDATYRTDFAQVEVDQQHVNLELTYSQNRVNLPNGSFTTKLVGTRLLYGFTPRLFLNAFIQYNADTHQVNSNIRFNFIHHPLSDLYLVYNDRRDTIRGEPVERAFIIKLTNLFNF